MRDTAQTGVTPPDSPEKPDRPGKRGLLADPVVRGMVYASLVLVVLYLAAVIGFLGTGVIKPSSPRTVAEKDLMIATAQLTPQARGEAWVPYIDALIEAGDWTGARVALARARASADATAPVSDLDLAEARLLRATGDNAKAVKLADKAMEGYKAEYDALIAKGGEASTSAKGRGYGVNYYNAVLVKAYALQELGRWKDAVAAFDVYLLQHQTAADILVDRGYAKLELKDTAGAEKDFRAALKFVPYDEQAKAGLKKIGVAE